MQEADVLVVGEVVLVEGEVVDVGQVHDLGHDVVETLKQVESSWENPRWNSMIKREIMFTIFNSF